ncbi:hypothetical protein [Vibrio ichthyoenteri]|nr:hypothetical protein [Vibrio ichthyoenteri]
MRKGIVVGLTLGVGVVIMVASKYQLFGFSHATTFPQLPENPNFTVSKDFDGEWLGRRKDVSKNWLCERTTISGKVVDGFVQLTLTYNGTPLKGWIDEQGALTLYATNARWDYRFTATASGNRIQGDWFLTNGPCKGSWYVERS